MAIANRRIWRFLCLYFGLSFLFHLAWELAQMPLFESKGLGIWEQIRMCLWATATGDMVFMAIIYAVLSVIHRQWTWISDPRAYKHPATWTLPVLVGVLIAMAFELWAVYAVERWEYAAMPIVPILQVGVTPVLQMVVIPLAVLEFCRRAILKRRRTLELA